MSMGPRLKAEIVLRVPDGREFVVTDKWTPPYADTPEGRAEAAESFEWSWREGNQSCDCNRMQDILRQHGVRLWDGDMDDLGCGNTIELVRFTVMP